MTITEHLRPNIKKDTIEFIIFDWLAKHDPSVTILKFNDLFSDDDLSEPDVIIATFIMGLCDRLTDVPSRITSYHLIYYYYCAQRLKYGTDAT